MLERIKYWQELSDYDLESAFAMYESKRYLYVGFMCHQAIEKIFKACYVKCKAETTPYWYSLSCLAKKGEFYDTFLEAQKDFIDQSEPLIIETRYPSHKERLIESLTHDKHREIVEKTKELPQWIKTKL